MSDLIAHYWYIGAFAIAAIVLFTQAKTAIAVAKKTIANFRLRLLLFVSDRLEPDIIATFRHSITKTFGELSNFLEKSELELLRSRRDNVFLKDKIQELEQNREALLQELGGSSDFLNIEFSIWQQMFQAVDLLVNDRLALLQKIELINSYDGNFEALSKDLETLQANNKAAEQRISALLDERTTLQVENGQLSRHNEHLQTRITELEDIETTVQTLELRIVSLKDAESKLQYQLDQCKCQNTQLEQQVTALKKSESSLQHQLDQFKRQNAQAEQGKNLLENHIQSNRILRKENERLRNELAQMKTQVQQQVFQRDNTSTNKFGNSQKTLSPEDLSIIDFYQYRTNELETEISYLHYHLSKLIAIVNINAEADYLNDSDYLSYVEYWRGHPDYY